MKTLLSLVLGLALVSFTSAAAADDVTIGVTKVSDSKAKVAVWPSGKPESVVPISFDTDASWTNVKDSYTVSSDTAAALEAKKMSLSVGPDGTLTFHSMKMKKSMASKTAK